MAPFDAGFRASQAVMANEGRARPRPAPKSTPMACKEGSATAAPEASRTLAAQRFSTICSGFSLKAFRGLPLMDLIFSTSTSARMPAGRA